MKCAVDLLSDPDTPYEKIIIVRPAVEAEEKLGSLPGGVEEKLDPYIFPSYYLMNKLVLILCLAFISCSRLEYPIVTKYKEHYPKVKYERIKQKRESHPKQMNPLVRDFIIWTMWLME